MLGMSNSGGGETQFTMGMLMLGIASIVLSSILFPMFLQSSDADSPYALQIKDVEKTYYNITGSHSTPEMNIWTLTGVYTPFNGSNYGYTPDGWVYGSKVKEMEPVQYMSIPGYLDSLKVVQQPNGLWYYLQIPKQQGEGGDPLLQDVVLVHYDNQGNLVIPDDATVYSAVYFDNQHKSNIFFTPSTKTTTDNGYYYEFTGWRYVYQPMTSFSMNKSGETVKVDRSSTSLSLIWYQYATTTSGIQGQLQISGSDEGVSYLAASDIIKAFSSATMSSKFDMTFNSCQMHLVIRLDPNMYSKFGGDVEWLYNNGYYSVMVYSDQIAESMTSGTFEFSIDNIWSTMMSILTFNLDKQYNIDGWMSVVASLFISLPFYMALLALQFENWYVWILMGVLQLVQAIGSIWPF